MPKRKNNIGANPLGSALAITVQMPKEIEIQMVNASELTDYQVWSGLAAFSSNVVVGFFVSSVTNMEKSLSLFLWIITIVALILTGIFGYMAWRKMTNMKKDQKPVRLSVTNQVANS